MRIQSPSGELVQPRSLDFLQGSYDLLDLSGYGHGGVELTPGPSGARLYKSYRHIYKSNPWVYAAVDLIAFGLSRMPLQLYQHQADGSRIRVRGDIPTVGRPSAGQSLDLLLRVPYRGVSMRTQIRRTVVDVAVEGSALWVKQTDSTGALVGLRHVPWRYILPKYDQHQTEILYFQENPVPISEQPVGPDDRDPDLGSAILRHLPEDVILFVYSADPDAPIGLSPLASLRHTLRLWDAMERHLSAFFANQARPSGQLKLDKDIDPRVLQEIRRDIAERYANPDKAGMPLITTGDWQPFGFDAQQSSIVELIKLSREEVASALHIPPPVLGILDRAIMGNVRELREQYVRDVIGPWAQLFEAELYAQLIWPNDSLRSGGYFVEWDLDQPLRPDIEARARAAEDLRRIWTVNELRAKDNLPPLDTPEADTVWVPSGDLPVGSVTSTRPAQQSAAPAPNDQQQGG